MGIQVKFHVQAKQGGKEQAGLKLVGMFIAQNKELYLGTSNPDRLHDEILKLYPDAKLSKHKGYVLVEKRE